MGLGGCVTNCRKPKAQSLMGERLGGGLILTGAGRAEEAQQQGALCTAGWE